MNFGTIVDTAIGLVLVYLILSLFCTTINEFVASLLRLRASTLRQAMDKLIDDDTLKGLFYDHGLIDTAKVSTTAGAQPASKGPGRGTANVMAPTAGMLGYLWQRIERFWRYPHPSYFASADVAKALADSLITNPKIVPKIGDIETAVLALPPSNIRDVLVTSLTMADGKIEKLQENLSAWFDSSMDRLSGSYKRNLQIISLIVGFIVALAFNANTVTIATRLWSDPSLTAQMVTSATGIVKDGKDKYLADACADKSDADKPQCYGDRLAALDAQIQPLPLGWVHCPSWLELWQGLLGLLLTTIALSLGAPFWFDTLSMFVNLRSAGDKPKPAKK